MFPCERAVAAVVSAAAARGRSERTNETQVTPRSLGRVLRSMLVRYGGEIQPSISICLIQPSRLIVGTTVLQTSECASKSRPVRLHDHRAPQQPCFVVMKIRRDKQDMQLGTVYVQSNRCHRVLFHALRLRLYTLLGEVPNCIDIQRQVHCNGRLDH